MRALERCKIEVLGQIKCGVALSNNGYDRNNDCFNGVEKPKFQSSGLPMDTDDTSLEPQAAENKRISDDDGANDDDLSYDEPASSEKESEKPEFYLDISENEQLGKKDRKYMFIEIDCCMDLKNSSGGRQQSLKDMYGGKSEINPFVVIKVNEKEIGRTPTIENSTKPFWLDQCFEFPVSEMCSVVLEVWTIRIPRKSEALNASYRNEQLLGEASISIPSFQANQNEGFQDIISNLTMEVDTNELIDEYKDCTSQLGDGSDLVVEGNDYRVPPPKTLRLRDELMKMTEVPKSFIGSPPFIAIICMVGYYIVGVLAYSFIFENWSVTDSIYFSTVTLTTVGYGDIYPTKTGTVIFTSFFTVLAIGFIGMTFINYIGEAMVNTTVKNLNGGHHEHDKDSRYESHEQRNDSDDSFPLFRERVVLFCTIASIVCAAGFIGYFERWSFIETLYWCIITGTTVGYGDFSPTKSETKWIAFFLLPCLVVIFGMLLARLSDVVINKEIDKINAKVFEREVTAEDLAKMDADDDEVVTELEFVVYMLKELDKIDQALVDKLHELYAGLDPDSDGINNDDLKIKLQDRLRQSRLEALTKYESNLLQDRVVSTQSDATNNV